VHVERSTLPLKSNGEIAMDNQIERWGVFEASLEGPEEGNPFVDVQLSARFRFGHRVVDVEGFYDGNGIYRVRFMPDTAGVWRYVTSSNCEELNSVAGEFRCVEPSLGNHGPVYVQNTYHFAYADGMPYIPVGTTCYAWVHQGDRLEEKTLETLRSSPFNKLRMCIFPKHYTYNENEPLCHPFERDEQGGWDFSRFNPEFFRHLERRVGDLLALGIEADLILFHPYDRWGYATMDASTDDTYLRYVVSRLAPYRNVWWSMANEFDLMSGKTMGDWDRFFRTVQECDPYQHLRSVHNCRAFYSHGKPWVTHQSIQHSALERVDEWRSDYQKPVVVDECRYEGDVQQRWGNITAQEMVRRIWEGTVRGGYVGHGETYLHPDDILWWSKGGALHGQSPSRIAFLRSILEEGPEEGLDPVDSLCAGRFPCAGKEGHYYLCYFGVHQPAEMTFDLRAGHGYGIDIIDTWDMTITHKEGRFEGRFQVELPGKPYIAVRIRRGETG
jgi:hypothetical protein